MKTMRHTLKTLRKRHRKARQLLRVRARLEAKHEELNRLCHEHGPLTQRQLRELVRMKGMIAGITASLNQLGWPGEQNGQ